MEGVGSEETTVTKHLFKDLFEQLVWEGVNWNLTW
jgi:hypothetical protein